MLFRSAMLMGFALLAVFGSKKAEWSGAGPLAALTLAFVAALRWRQEAPEWKKVRLQSDSCVCQSHVRFLMANHEIKTFVCYCSATESRQNQPLADSKVSSRLHNDIYLYLFV